MIRTSTRHRDPVRLHPVAQAQGDCVQSRIDTYNPLNDPAQRPLSPGHRQQYGLNVAGGTDAATYYVSAEYEGEVGVYKLRGFDFDSVSQATNGNIPRGAGPAQRAGQAQPSRQRERQGRVQRRSAALPRLPHQPAASAGERQHPQFGDRKWRRERVPPGHQSRMVPGPGRDFCGAEPSGHRAVHRRPHRELAAAAPGLAPERRSATT